MVKFWENCKKWGNLHIQESYRWQASAYLPDVTSSLICKWFFKGLLGQLLLCYFFYRSWWAVIGLFPITIGLMFMQWEGWRKQVLLDIEDAFKDWLFYVKGGLTSGKSMEQAILKSKQLFLGTLPVKHPIRLGLEQIYRSLELHIPIENSIRRMGMETKVDAIEDFALVFEIAKKQGNRMTTTLEKTICQIYERIELRLEIQAMISAKKLEQRIMCIMPFGILLFVGNASGGYFEPLYHNFRGNVIMTVCMLVYLFGVWWGERLTEVSI